jgi:hypothetical protein
MFALSFLALSCCCLFFLVLVLVLVLVAAFIAGALYVSQLVLSIFPLSLLPFVFPSLTSLKVCPGAV